MATIAQVQQQLQDLQKSKAEIEQKTRELLNQGAAAIGSMEVPCTCCNRHIPLRRYTFIQKRRYIEPHGHTGGDHWVDSPRDLCYLQCPDCAGRIYIYNHPDWDILVTMLKGVYDLKRVFEPAIITEE